MFSKSKINEPAHKPAETKPAPTDTRTESPRAETGGEQRSTSPKAKPPASVLSSDLHVVGNLRTTGDIQVEGTIEGDIRAHLLTVGEGATIKGEVIADDVVVNGRIVGRVRGLKVRLTSTARVEGSVQRQDDPLNSKGAAQKPAAAAQQPAASGSSASSGSQQQPAAKASS